MFGRLRERLYFERERIETRMMRGLSEREMQLCEMGVVTRDCGVMHQCDGEGETPRYRVYERYGMTHTFLFVRMLELQMRKGSRRMVHSLTFQTFNREGGIVERKVYYLSRNQSKGSTKSYWYNPTGRLFGERVI